MTPPFLADIICEQPLTPEPKTKYKNCLYLAQLVTDYRCPRGPGPTKCVEHFYRVCHIELYFWNTSGFLIALELQNGVPRPKQFLEATNIKIHAVLSHMAKCFDLCLKILLNFSKKNKGGGGAIG